jgi:tetraacyldisaccharide 4'-kinase
MAGALQRAWLRRGPLAFALWPISVLYGAVARLRRALYGHGLLTTHRIRVPVIVVGNVVAGGAGKTPVVIAVVEHLRARGLQVGVVSRGHGRTSTGCVEVMPTSEPRDTGDEPLLVARRCHVPVVVDADRPNAACVLLERHPQVQVIVADDGLQHLALGRDIEILVFDARGAGNGWLLPAGPLREPAQRKADLVLRPPQLTGIAGHSIRRKLAAEAVRADGTRRALADLAREPCAALAAIAQPEAFFAMLREAGVPLVATISRPDHDSLEAPLPSLGDARHLLCTEKDAAKLWRSHPEAWAVPLEASLDDAFWRELDALLDAKLSSTHGPQTA